MSEPPIRTGLAKLKARVVRSAGAQRVMLRLPRDGRIERFLLSRWWSSLPADALDSYLVSGYQDPLVNVQSILLRHFLVRRLFGDAFDDLMRAELRFVVELNEVLRLRAAELGVKMGSYINADGRAAVAAVDHAIADRRDEFAGRWREALEGREAEPISILELACGSANDYRAFVECGLARFLEYRGIDLTPKNIENARRRFPGVRFEVGDVREVSAPDGSVDYVIASDILEHLSSDGREAALDEAMRIARRGVALTFFNMAELDQHEIHERRVYYWNRLSRRLIEERLRATFASVEVIAVHEWLKSDYAYTHTYNRHAYSIFAEVSVPS